MSFPCKHEPVATALRRGLLPPQQRRVLITRLGGQVVTDRPRAQLVRAFLDGSQYSAVSILRYERMFGKGFVSTGGLATTQASDALAPCAWR